MKNILILCCLLVFFWRCNSSTDKVEEAENKDTTLVEKQNSEKKTDAKWICIPGKSVGKIDSSATEASLIAEYGKDEVLRDSISLGEGEYTIGTRLFPNTKNEISILWRDAQKMEQPDNITIRNGSSDWKTKQGVCVGMTLDELHKLNQGNFELYGFGWDYAGTIADWNGGKLGENHVIGVQFRLQLLPTAEYNDPKFAEILGSKTFPSDNKLFAEMELQIEKMTILFKY